MGPPPPVGPSPQETVTRTAQTAEQTPVLPKQPALTSVPVIMQRHCSFRKAVQRSPPKVGMPN
jgi:hypothetical protein